VIVWSAGTFFQVTDSIRTLLRAHQIRSALFGENPHNEWLPGLVEKAKLREDIEARSQCSLVIQVTTYKVLSLVDAKSSQDQR
jgi:hypothetical protein